MSTHYDLRLFSSLFISWSIQYKLLLAFLLSRESSRHQTVVVGFEYANVGMFSRTRVESRAGAIGDTQKLVGNEIYVSFSDSELDDRTRARGNIIDA